MLKYAILVSLIVTSLGTKAEMLSGRIVAVTDGDTVILLSHDNRQHRIRLLGVDAPEKVQPYGNKSKAALASLIFGKPVEADCTKRDRYGRELCKIVLDGQDINLAQVRAGMAWWYRKYANEQSSVDQTEYGRAEHTARESRLGLWSDNDPTPPWEWRHSLR